MSIYGINDNIKGQFIYSEYLSLQVFYIHHHKNRDNHEKDEKITKINTCYGNCLSLFPLDALAAGTPKKSGYETKASYETERLKIRGQSCFMNPLF